MNDFDEILNSINDANIKKLRQEIQGLEKEHNEFQKSLDDIKDIKEKYAISWRLMEILLFIISSVFKNKR
ncbi:unnamed protein product [marine sediment metagenome]|uniref:Uncharacterized protein n=1 Tax=marine sediment metagenome TaxID=412755 RepID=X0RYN3_9ZZZZ